MDMLLGLGSGVAVNYISNELLQGLSGIREKRELQAFKRSLEDWAIGFEAAHEGTIASSGVFASYVKNHHIVEAVIRYVLLPDGDGLDEPAFFEQMERSMVQDMEEKRPHKLSSKDVEVISSFLESLLAKTKDFVSDKLPVQEQILLYRLCQLQAQDARLERLLLEHFQLTEEKLAQLLAQADAAQAGPTREAPLPQEFDRMILSCNRTLQKSQEKVRVYSWDDLPFDAVYVPPSLDTSLNDQNPLWHLKYPRSSLLPWLAFDGESMDLDFLVNLYSEVELLTIPQKDTIENRRQRINTIFDFSDLIYVIGGAGCGKSLFLQKLCVDPKGLTGYKENPRLIIRGDLKRMIQPDGLFKPMRQYLEECFVHACLCKPEELAPDFLDRCLRAGRCLILLDALDEVGNDQRNELHQRVIDYFQTIGPGNKVCITSRDRGFIPDETITCFTICPITDHNVSEYVDRFIQLGKFQPEERDRFIQQASTLVEKGFVTGFLTLSLLLAIYRNEQDLPANKVSLYEKCFEYIANSRERLKRLLRNSSTGEEYDWSALTKLMNEATFMQLARLGTPNNQDIPREQIDRLMTDLYQTRFQSQTECRIALEMFLQFCADRTEVFVPSPNSNLEYRFFHRSFYEFFYANYLVLYSEGSKDVYEKLFHFGIDSELFELLTALYYQKNPFHLRKLLQYAFEQAETQLQAPTPSAGSVFDILVMLMQTADESDFTERFIKLFMEHGGRISTFSLTTSFQLIHRVFAQSIPYFEELYRNHQPLYTKKLARSVAEFLLRNRDYFSPILKVGPKFHGTTRKPIKEPEGFQYIDLLKLLPDRLALLDQIVNSLRSPFQIYSLLNGKGAWSSQHVNALSAFANKVYACPPKERENLYSMLFF